jgi:hypothetical protein
METEFADTRAWSVRNEEFTHLTSKATVKLGSLYTLVSLAGSST